MNIDIKAVMDKLKMEKEATGFIQSVVIGFFPNDIVVHPYNIPSTEQVAEIKTVMRKNSASCLIHARESNDQDIIVSIISPAETSVYILRYKKNGTRFEWGDVISSSTNEDKKITDWLFGDFFFNQTIH